MAIAKGELLQWVCYTDAMGNHKEAIQFQGNLYDTPVEPDSMGARNCSLTEWLESTVGKAESAIARLEGKYGSAKTSFARAASLTLTPREGRSTWQAPLTDQEIWGAGVTYQRSREARQEEAQDGGDVYARVYAAERPELFYKGNARTVVGHGGQVGIRADSDWDVPEPELAVLFNPALEAVGFSIGLDMSSRSIEGENPLYLPQAKIFNASCALGPGVMLQAAEDWPYMRISITIERKGCEVFRGETDTDQLARRLPELADYLGRSNDFPQGVYLLTGTGIVPPAEFTLLIGDVIRTEISGLGALENTVVQV